MSFKVLFQILKSRWLSFVLVFVPVLTLAGLITWLTPKTYTASASLVVDVKADPVAGTVLASTASPGYLLTQVDILQSSRVAQRVVRDLKLTEIPQLRQQWQDKTAGAGDFSGWLGDLLRANLDVRPSRGSNVINLYYNGADPKFVANVANAFVKSYLDTLLEMRTVPAKDYTKFFDANSKELREKLEAAQTKLSSFQQSKGLIISDERLDVETQRLNELSAQLVGVQAAAADTQSRQTQAQGAQGDRMMDVMNSPLVASIRTDLTRQEATLESLSGRLGENHPSVRELKLGIADTRAKLDQEVKRAQSSVGINNQVNQSRVAQARQSLEEQRAKVLKLRAVRDEASVLQREVESAQRTYDGVLGRLSMTNLESQTNQANVASLEQATAPNVASSPRVGLNMLLGLMVATILGVAMVWAREARDRRVRSPSDFELLLNLPLVGVMPSFGGQRRLARSDNGLQRLSQSAVK